MDFEVNDDVYILRLAEDERRWQFFVSTPNGARRIPVYVDAPRSAALIVFDEENPNVLPN